jgi:hypothetical protein
MEFKTHSGNLICGINLNCAISVRAFDLSWQTKGMRRRFDKPSGMHNGTERNGDNFLYLQSVVDGSSICAKSEDETDRKGQQVFITVKTNPRAVHYALLP